MTDDSGRKDDDSGREDNDRGDPGDDGREDDDDSDDDEGGELERLRRTAAARKDELKKLRRELSEAKRGGKSADDDKAGKDDDAERRAAEREQAANRRLVGIEVTAELRATAGLTREDAQAVAGLLDLSAIEVDDDGRVDPDDVTELVEKLRKTFGGSERESRGGGRVDRRQRKDEGESDPDKAHSRALLRQARGR